MNPIRRRAAAAVPVLMVLALLYSCLPALRVRIGAPIAIAQAVRPAALASSPKPAWRVDSANTGRLTTAGPVTPPNQVFSQKTAGNSTIITGVQLDSSGNIIVGDAAGKVYSYAPAGALIWTSTLGAGTGQNIRGSALSATIGNDGALYVGADNGYVYQLNPGVVLPTPTPGGNATPVGNQVLTCRIFQAPLNGGVEPKITTMVQIDGNNHLLVGDDGGTFYSVTPPAPASTCPSGVSPNWAFSAVGSTPTSGISAGQPSVAPFSFFGQAALDGQGDVFVASTDGNSQQAGKPQTLGSLYSLNASTGAPNWTVPLLGRVQGAVVYDAAANEVIVADGDGEVIAVTATGNSAGTVMWSKHPKPSQNGTASQFIASPALSSDGQTIYVQDTAYLYALTASTGALSSSFDPSPPAPANGEQNAAGTVVDNGSTSSPVVDSVGNIYVQTSTGSLVAFSASGATLWTIEAGTGNGQSGSYAGLSGVSPAISSVGTLYASGNKGYVRGFNILSSAGQTATQIAILTGTTTSTVTNTSTQTSTSGPTDTDTQTDIPTNTVVPGSTNTNTGTPTSTVVPGSTNTNTGSPTKTNTQTPTPTATQTLTQTATASASATATSSATVTATRTPGTSSPSASPTPNWSRLRGDTSNGGTNVNVKLDLSAAPGPVFATKLGSSGLANTPMIGPDGTIYEPDGTGKLAALNPNGSVKWSSTSALGVSLVAGSYLKYFDSGSSPALGPDGYIYIGSETKGVYRFDPADGKVVAHDGSANPFFNNGSYNGSSVTIGPDGAVYVGSTGQDGTFYSINPDGSQRYAYTPKCKIGTPQFQSTAVLDGQGNAYVGYICVTSGAQPSGGGLIKLDRAGNKQWAFIPTKAGTDDGNGSAMYGAAILSSSGQTVYALDIGGDRIFAVATDSGQPRWFFHGDTPLRSVPTLSPQGDTLYLGTTGNLNIPQDLYAIRAADGTVAKAVSITDPGADATGGVAYAAPAVDGAGQVLFGFVGGLVQAYSAGLGQQLFSELINNQPGSAIVGGPAIATSGTIYVTNGKGYIVGLKAGVQLPPTVTPNPTIPLPPTQAPPPTDTQVAVIGGGTSSPTPKPGTGTPTATPSSGAHTPTATAVGTTTIGHSTPPVASATPVATPPGEVVKSGNGFTAKIDPGTLIKGNLALLTVKAVKGSAHIGYSMKFSFMLAKKPITTVLKASPASPRCSVAATVEGTKGLTLNRTADARGRDVFCLRLSSVPANAIGLQVAMIVQVRAGDTTYKPSPLSFMVAKSIPMRVTVAPGLLLPKGTGAITVEAASGAQVTYQISYPGAKPQILKRTVGSKGVDKFTFKTTYTPSRQDGQVQATVSVSSVLESIVKGSAGTQFTVRRTDVVLTLTKLQVKVLTPKVRPKGAVQIDLVAARGAYIKYTITYGSQKAKYSYGLVPDGSGYATIHFPAAYTPARGKSTSVAVNITASQGKKVLHATAKFSIQG